MHISDVRAHGGSRRSRRLATVAATSCVVGALVTVAPAAAGQRGHAPLGDAHTVATGLDNPRGITFTHSGKLVVAEAGHAGDVCLFPGFCFGLTGKVTEVKQHDRHVTLADGLTSAGGPYAAFGLGGVTRQGQQLRFIMGLNPQALGDPAEDCQGQPDEDACVAVLDEVQAQAGYLNRLNSHSTDKGWTSLAGVGEFDFDYAAAHPDPGNPEYAPGDANPFGVAAAPSGGTYVVDAASNTLDLVSPSGHVSVLAGIPDPPDHEPIYDAAPTCAATTADGDVFIGTESNTLWRWDGTELTQVLAGGSIGEVVGCAADAAGNLYLANLTSEIGPDFTFAPFDGSIVKVAPDLTTSYVATGLNYPTGLSIGPDGSSLYVAVNGLCPSDLSLLTSDNSPPGACPAPGEIIRMPIDD